MFPPLCCVRPVRGVSVVGLFGDRRLEFCNILLVGFAADVNVSDRWLAATS